MYGYVTVRNTVLIFILGAKVLVLGRHAIQFYPSDLISAAILCTFGKWQISIINITAICIFLLGKALARIVQIAIGTISVYILTLLYVLNYPRSNVH